MSKLNRDILYFIFEELEDELLFRLLSLEDLLLLAFSIINYDSLK